MYKERIHNTAEADRHDIIETHSVLVINISHVKHER